MSRKRHRLVPEAFGQKRRREGGDVEADPLRGESGSARAAVAELVRLFPRVLFEDALPPIALRSQVYSLVPDRTVADRQLRKNSPILENKISLHRSVQSTADHLTLTPFFSLSSLWRQKALQEQGEIRIIQLGFDLDAQGIIFTEDYRTRVRVTVQLVNAGVLTVRDAGSWWLAVPGAGRFIKYFVKGRQAVLGMVRKAKYRELLLSELLGRRAPAAARLGLAYHVHDLIGSQLVDCVSTTSGTLLRLPET
ncbi:inactive serine/threonine-protein kinase 19 isoform X3 [Physeter macrocephalus]|uniref:Inactive serine/threonine-protein kinase 19 isoform X3 n=1 Tax=Physeter macrocephalus TaxID=9755 RepID=A0A9W2WAG6_PHYMC|nr:serine/threonine-protein kinase 19 isoform X3 [Physeter catodon]